MNRIGYILKVYPRFSETFVVTEILGREAIGDDISIFALRPTTDTRFHPELARVKAPVEWIARPDKPSAFWQQMHPSLSHPTIAQNFLRILPELSTLEASDVAQGIALAERLLERKITHIHAHFASLAGRMAWVASQLTGIGYTVTTHAKDIFHESVDRTWLRRICGDADRVIAISRFNQRYLEEVLEGTGASVVLRYNALELERFTFSPSVTPNTRLEIAAVGRLVPKKGFGNLLDAARILKDQGHDFRIRLAGSGELEAQLKQQIIDLELTAEVELLGPLTQAEVTQLNREVDVFVAPCVPSADGNIDGLPTVVLEAMAVGTPVIATAVTGLPEVIRDDETGVLLEPNDVEGLAAALAAFSRGETETSQLTHGARALIEEFFDNREQAKALSVWQGGAAAEVDAAERNAAAERVVAAHNAKTNPTPANKDSKNHSEVA